MYHPSASSSASTGMAMTSPTYSTYSLPRSRIGPVPSSSTPRYGFSIDYTDPYPSGQQSHPIWVSCSHPGTPSRTLPARENAGLVTLSNAGAPSTCTAMRAVRMPTPQGSNAPVSRVDGGSSLAPLRLYPCYEHKLSLGSKALEDQQMRVRAPLDDVSRLASMTPKSPSGCHAPSHSHSTWCGYAPTGTDPHF